MQPQTSQQQQKIDPNPMVSRLPPPMVADKVEILNIEEYHQDPTMLTVVLHEEDHTIGNALKHIICQMYAV